MKYSLALHGGAGTILKSKMTAEKESAYKEALSKALNRGVRILEKGGSAIDAVEKTVQSLEDSPLFNAGRGSVFNADGKHEMDAAIMEGANREAGGVCNVSSIKNPVVLARKIMDNSEHVLLSGEGAELFASLYGLEREDEQYFHDQFRYQQWLEVKGSDKFKLDHSDSKDHKFGTVGAVAMDTNGLLAAATSTGGMTNKKYSRIGDSPIIGAGNYANNNTCAVSCTGSGEYFMRTLAAYRVSALMELKNMKLNDACNEVVHKELIRLNGDGGLIAVDTQGKLELSFNTDGMYRAWKTQDTRANVEIYKD